MSQLITRLLNKLAYSLPGGFTVRPQLHRWRGAHIGRNVWISQYVYLDVLHPEGIYIEDDVTIGIRASIITHFYWGPRRPESGFKEVHIGREVFVGPHCLILPGVRIGEGAVIKGGSVVSRDVPAHAFWGPPNCGPLGLATVPLTPTHSYEEFIHGLKPWPRGS